MSKIRLFVENDIAEKTILILDEKQSHYLTNVMKQKLGNQILCFNGKTGEYNCEIASLSKKSMELVVLEKVREFEKSPDLWILFAPLKKDKTDFVIQKATELGVSKIVPTITKHTIAEKVRTDRFVMQTIEASEQCQRLDIPEISQAIKLETLLNKWDNARILYIMDETGSGENILQTFAKNKTPSAILVGPEGGFSSAEIEILRKQPFVKMISLGKRILRAETAVLSAISCWQATCGDW